MVIGVAIAVVLVGWVGTSTPGEARMPARVSVALVADEPGLVFHRVVAEEAPPVRLCATPCRADLRAGAQWLGLSRGDDDDVALAAAPVLVTPATHALAAALESRRGHRIGGGVLAVASVATIVAFSVADFAYTPDCGGICLEVVVPNFVVNVLGIMGGVAGLIVSGVLVQLDDVAVIEAR